MVMRSNYLSAPNPVELFHRFLEFGIFYVFDHRIENFMPPLPHFNTVIYFINMLGNAPKCLGMENFKRERERAQHRHPPTASGTEVASPLT